MKFNKLLYSVLIFLTTITSNAQNWNLVWADEFETYGSVDEEKWFHQTQLPDGYSWFNNELQHYTDEIENSYVSDGNLKIVAKKENYTDQGHTKQYTSARLNSKFAFMYGKVEVRAKLPYGQGTWPAIWTLGKNVIESGSYWTNQGYGTTYWPNCGEIDIMEHWGTNQNYIQSATHTPSSYGATINHGGQNISTVSSEFHTYGLIWTEDELIFSVDEQVHYIYNPPLKDSETWPFDAEQFLLMNIAIDQNITSNFQQSALEIDYVRIYQDVSSDLSLVNFTVDMNGVDQPSAEYENVVVNGSWNGWNGWGVTLTEDAAGIWTGSLELAPGTSFEYVVAVTGLSDDYSGWGMQWGDGCQGANVSVTVGSAGSVTETNLVAGCSDITGCVDENASNYDASATSQQLDQYGNLNCLYTSCDDIPEPGCIYSDGFGPFNTEFNASDCINYGGTSCEENTSDVYGCMDENATNYNINATMDNGTCQYECIPDWQVTVTDQNHSIFISGVSYDLEGNILSEGSQIGVFYYYNDSYICAGYTELHDGIMQIAVMGDDIGTDELDGLVDGSPLIFMVWDSNFCEMFPADVLFSNGPEVYTSNGITFITDIMIRPNGPISQEINCLAGWSIFSTFMESTDMQMNSILSTIVDDVIIAKDYLGSAFLPEFNFNGIGELTVGWGYQLKMENERSLIIGGDYAFPENNPVELSAGWNLIGYLRTESALTNQILSDFVDAGNLIIVKDYLGAAYLPEYDFNGIGNMLPGYGYQIKLVDAGILQYLSNDESY